MTILHHLFSNFDTAQDKAASLFRKLNSLHLRHTASTTHEGAASSSARLGASPMSHRGRMKSARAVTGSAVEARLSASTKKLINSQASSIFLVRGPSPA